jgi:diguanylate cyclase (GGDEF)-like protein
MSAEQAERPVVVTEEDRAQAAEGVNRNARGAIVGGIAMVGVTNLFAGQVLDAIFPNLRGAVRVLALAGVSVLMAAPLLYLVASRTMKKAIVVDSQRFARERQALEEVRRREFENRLANALEMADQEPEALEAAERALSHVVPEAPAELLLADNSHAHLVRVAASTTTEPPGCPVDSPQACVAARRGQAMVFPDSEALDACPKLRDRASGACSAACVPVSIMGRSVGVLHVTSGNGHGAPDHAVAELQVLANQLGNRIGMLRVMAETQLQASTDGLTGLLNRRSFENKVRMLRRQGAPFALVMADLDDFKRLNDTHGHDVGDRALRVFAETLRSVVRPDDLLCRYGGEEFVIVLPDCSILKAAEVMERVRGELATIGTHGDAPSFTASFGVVASDHDEDLDELVSRADAALYRAKSQGRNRVVAEGQPAGLGPLFASDGRACARAPANGGPGHGQATAKQAPN